MQFGVWLFMQFGVCDSHKFSGLSMGKVFVVVVVSCVHCTLCTTLKAIWHFRLNFLHHYRIAPSSTIIDVRFCLPLCLFLNFFAFVFRSTTVWILQSIWPLHICILRCVVSVYFVCVCWFVLYFVCVFLFLVFSLVFCCLLLFNIISRLFYIQCHRIYRILTLRSWNPWIKNWF